MWAAHPSPHVFSFTLTHSFFLKRKIILIRSFSYFYSNFLLKLFDIETLFMRICCLRESRSLLWRHSCIWLLCRLSLSYSYITWWMVVVLVPLFIIERTMLKICQIYWKTAQWHFSSFFFISVRAWREEFSLTLFQYLFLKLIFCLKIIFTLHSFFNNKLAERVLLSMNCHFYILTFFFKGFSSEQVWVFWFFFFFMVSEISSHYLKYDLVLAGGIMGGAGRWQHVCCLRDRDSLCMGTLSSQQQKAALVQDTTELWAMR